MDNNAIELNLTHENVSKLVIYEIGMALNDFYKEIQSIFNINLQIKLRDSNADITSVKSFYNGRKLIIETLAIMPRTDSSSESTEAISHIPSINGNINFDDIIEVEYPSKELLSKVNDWANKKKFNLMSTGGVKKSMEGCFRTLVCSKKNCKVRFTFKSNNDGLIYKLDKILAKKNSIHSKLVFFLINHCILRSCIGLRN